MLRLFRLIGAWRVRKHRFLPEPWEQVRAKGRRRFVLRKGLTWMVMMTATSDVLTHFFFTTPTEFGLWAYLCQGFFVGVFLGYGEWSDNEGKYKEALLNPPVSDLTYHQISPH